jgi:hypothetical protein
VRDTGAPDHSSYYHQDLVARIKKYEMASFDAQQLLFEDYPTRYYWESSIVSSVQATAKKSHS